MAYQTSNKYSNYIYDENSEQNIQIIINNIPIDGSYVKQLTLDDDVFESDTFSLGSAIPSKVVLELDNDLFDEISSNFNEITFVFSLTEGEDIENIPMNTYIVKEVDNSSKEYTKYTLYDYMEKFNKEGFDASNVVPCTRFEFLQALCTYCGVQLENQSIINGDVIVDVYDNSILPRTYLSLISERAGGFAKINRNNKLEIKTFADVDTVQLPVNKIGDHDYQELRTVTKVVYQNATQIFEAGTDTGTTIFLTQDSPFSCSQAEVDAIYQELNGLQYQTLDVRIWGDPAIDTGDLITFNGLKTFAQKHWTWGNGFYGNYKATLKDGQGMNVSKLSGNTKRKRLESRMNEVEGTVNILSEQVDDNSENIAEINLSMNNITNRVSSVETGLNNTNEEITTVKNTVEANQNATEYKINVINQQLISGVTKFDTTTGYTFDVEGLQITKTDSEFKILINNEGVVVSNGSTEKLRADSNGVVADNFTVNHFLIHKPIRSEHAKASTDSTKDIYALFWVGM